MPWRYMWEWRHSSTILNFGTRWAWMLSFKAGPLYSRGKIPWHPSCRRLVGPQGRSVHCIEEKNLSTLSEIESRTSSLCPSQYRLSFPAHSIVHKRLIKTGEVAHQIRHSDSLFGKTWRYFNSYRRSQGKFIYFGGFGTFMISEIYVRTYKTILRVFPKLIKMYVYPGRRFAFESILEALFIFIHTTYTNTYIGAYIKGKVFPVLN
jgi:hypothetical protein